MIEILDFGTWLNNSGIILETFGFILILIAIRPMPRKAVDVRECIEYLEDIMSARRPCANCFGVGLIIFGLSLQITFSVI